MTSMDNNSNESPLLGCIADDVTGATDLAINLVQGGMRVVQVLGVPDAAVLSEVKQFDAIVVALKTRSIPAPDAIAQSLQVVRALEKIGIARFYFKYCSTFDSTAAGNIGPVAEALMDELGVEQTIFCPAFPRAGRTVYQGHLFVGDRLLSESGMQNHPLNPMTDANLVRWLSQQSKQDVGLISYATINEGSAQIQKQLTELAASGIKLVVTDTCDQSHLDHLADAVASLPLITGGSGLARFLPSAYRELGVLKSAEFVPELPRVSGRSLIVAGSCSTATNKQVNWMQNKCATWRIDVAAVIEDSAREMERMMMWARSTGSDQTLLVSSTSEPGIVAGLQQQFGVDAAAAAIEKFLSSVTKTLIDELGVRRIVLAGGETSGAIVRRLAIRSLRIGPEICAGVPWTETMGCEPRLALALKSGNFGEEDFFETALEMLS